MVQFNVRPCGLNHLVKEFCLYFGNALIMLEVVAFVLAVVCKHCSFKNCNRTENLLL